MAKKKTKKKKIIPKPQFVRGLKLSPEQYNKLVKQFKDRSKDDGESKVYRNKLIAERLKMALERGDKEAARKQVGWAAKSKLQKFTSNVSPGTRKLDTKIGETARKAINLVAPKGFVKSITRPKGSSQGRGRPSGTFKTRFVPGKGFVKVPTHIYKRMMAEAKAKQRLAAAQRQAMAQQQLEQRQIAAEQVAMSQDPRFQQSQEDAWAEGEDMQHEQEVIQAKQEMLQRQAEQQYLQQFQQKPQGIVQRTGNMLSQFGRGLNNIGRSPLRGAPEQGSSLLGGTQQYNRPIQPQIQREPRVNVVSERSSILNTPNIFNRPEDVSVGFKRRV